MPVYQNSGGGLGEGLLAFGQNFAAARQRRQQSDAFEQEMTDRLTARTLQRAQLASQGIHILGPGEAPPFKDIGNDIADRMRMPEIPAIQTPQFDPVNGGTTPAPTSVPSTRAGVGALNIPGHPAANSAGGGSPTPTPINAPTAAAPVANDPTAMFRSLMANMAGGVAPQRGPRYETGQGYYIDHKPQWDQADVARAQHMQDQFEPIIVNKLMAADERNRKIQGYVAAGVHPDRAALYADNPSLADNDPTVGKPHTDVMAERTPKSVFLNGKPAEVTFDKAGKAYDAATGKPAVGTITPYVAPPNPESAALRELAFGQRKESLLARTEARLVGQYHNATKKYSQTADAIQAINENRTGALKGDPVAQQTLLQDFIKLNLPGQVVTAGDIHNYAGLMGLGEKGSQLLQQLQQGTPMGEQQIRLILQHADNLAAERRKGAKYLRDSYIQRGARQGVPEDSFEDWFGFVPAAETKGATGGGDTAVNPFASLIPPGKKP